MLLRTGRIGDTRQNNFIFLCLVLFLTSISFQLPTTDGFLIKDSSLFSHLLVKDDLAKSCKNKETVILRSRSNQFSGAKRRAVTNCKQILDSTSLYLSNDDDNNDDERRYERSFFIRPSYLSDMGKASEILADGFFRDKTNWWTYQWERLTTYLSLESTFPRPYTPHIIFVACDAQSGVVLGLVELDARPKETEGRKDNTKNGNYRRYPSTDPTGPYMCNVAVDRNHQRKGIATALIRKCEWQVQQWVASSEQNNRKSNGELLSCSLYLKVRANNQAAIQMYSRLGYMNLLQEKDPKTKEPVLIMRKELERPSASTLSSMEGKGKGVNV